MTTSITLLGFPKPFANFPSPSGFCQKIATYFRATGLEYVETEANNTKAPKGKLPCIVLSTPSNPKPIVIPDSHFIIKHLVANGIAPDLDANLTPIQKAESRAYQSWTEETLYIAVVVTRWFPTWEHNYNNVYDGLPIPWLIKPIIVYFLRSRIISALKAHGMGRHSKDEIEELIQEWVDGLSARLGDGEGWFHKTKEPTNIDVVLGGFLMQMMANPNREFHELVRKHKGLLWYTVRSVKRWFPEYDTLLDQLYEDIKVLDSTEF